MAMKKRMANLRTFLLVHLDGCLTALLFAASLWHACGLFSLFIIGILILQGRAKVTMFQGLLDGFEKHSYPEHNSPKSFRMYIRSC